MTISAAIPSLPINVKGGLGVDVSRQNGAVVVETRDFAITTGGAGATYTATSPRGDLRPTDGRTLLLRIDRPNTASPLLDLDGSGGRPWVDGNGTPLIPGSLVKDALMRATFDAARGAWFTDRLSGLTLAVFDTLMRLWLNTLPGSPYGIGPVSPWNNAGTLAVTDPANPKYDPVSAAARLDLLRLVRNELPTSPDGLAAGEPWLNGNVITFVPNP